MKALSIGFMLVGIVWALVVVWIHLVMIGITEPISAGSVFLYFGAMLLGPILLILGSILVLKGLHAKQGAILVLFGCTILSLIVGYSSIQDLHVEPLQVKPPYLFDACLIITALLSDVGAFRLYQLASSVNILGIGR